MNKKRLFISTLALLVVCFLSLNLFYTFSASTTAAPEKIENTAMVTYTDIDGSTHTEKSEIVQVEKEKSSPPVPDEEKPDEVKPDEATQTYKLKLTQVHPDAGGKALADQLSLNDEYITIKNLGETIDNIDGWKIKNRRGDVYNFPRNYKFTKYSAIKIKTGKRPAACRWVEQLKKRVCYFIPDYYFFMGRTSEMWNNSHDTITIYKGGTVILKQDY